MNDGLRRDYNAGEVVTALEMMNPLKAPGPDGMNALFFQTYWHIVGPSVTEAVLSILRGAPIPRGINKTFIALIPKKKNPETMVDFRPISLCNVVYKLVSKVLANRLKVFLNEVVTENQSAFVPGRLITNNILVAFELFHHMKNTRSGEGHMALKLDMSKAYDRVEWTFLEAVLQKLGFDSRWIERVMCCVSSVTFSVLINGSPSTEFAPSRGLRQGDPLSPYLFILCAEALSSLIRREAERGALHGIKIAQNSPSVSHLFFADDSIIFTKATVPESEVVRQVLALYERAFGQVVSFEKTKVSFSHSTSSDRRLEISQTLGVNMVDIHDKYLGLPTVVGRSKKVITNGVREKLWKKLQGWRGMILSKAGREVLIKAVAQSIPTYAMSIFKFPDNFCDEMRSLAAQFWWGQSQGKRKTHWVAWKKLCVSKELGGMGFRDFKMFNSALLGKQAWRLCTDTDSLMTRVLKGKYFPNSSYMTANLGPNPSYTWRGIWGARWVVESGARRRIGDGMSTRVWSDPWIPGTQSRKIMSPMGLADNELKVGDLLIPGTNKWNEQKVRTLFLPFEHDRILSIPLSARQSSDVWCWEWEKDGLYSVRSAYKIIVKMEGSTSIASSSREDKWLWGNIWKTRTLPRIKTFFWQLCKEALPTKNNIFSRLGQGSGECPICEGDLETELHLFRDCRMAKGVWELAEFEVELEGRFRDVRGWIELEWGKLGAEGRTRFMMLCWAMWGERNNLVFEGTHKGPIEICLKVTELMLELEQSGDEQVMQNGRYGIVRDRVWSPPRNDMVKINVDAGVLEGVGTCCGVVCRGSKGEVLWSSTLQQKEVWEVRVAEAYAVMIGLEGALAAGHRKIVVESDCQELINTLERQEKGRSIFHLIIDDIIDFCNSFDMVIWSFIGRLGNKVAHAMAHTHPWEIGRRSWMLETPLNVSVFAYPFPLAIFFIGIWVNDHDNDVYTIWF